MFYYRAIAVINTGEGSYIQAAHEEILMVDDDAAFVARLESWYPDAEIHILEKKELTADPAPGEESS